MFQRFFALLCTGLIFVLVACGGDTKLQRLTIDPVVRIDGCVGSGVIFHREDNIYSVLTARHVAQLQNICTVIAPNNQTKSIPPSQKFYPLGEGKNDVDLAIFKFRWDEKDWKNNSKYRILPVAKLGNSSKLKLSQNLRIVGIPAKSEEIPNPQITPVTAILTRNNDRGQGYSLTYTAQTNKGMSGGGVFTDNGLLVGIHGIGESKDGIKWAGGIPLEKLATVMPLKIEGTISAIPWQAISLITSSVLFSIGVWRITSIIVKNIQTRTERASLSSISSQSFPVFSSANSNLKCNRF
jgi:S1-C subfamily serine protease